MVVRDLDLDPETDLIQGPWRIVESHTQNVIKFKKNLNFKFFDQNLLKFKKTKIRNDFFMFVNLTQKSKEGKF